MTKILRYNRETGEVDEFEKESVPIGGSSVYLGNNAWSTGLKSVAAGCHSSQVNEFRQQAKDHGISGVDIRPDGSAVFHSRKGRADYLRMRGLFDRDAGYGDASPDNCGG